MEATPLFQIFAIAGFFLVLGAFLLVARTLGNMGISLLRLEYLLNREYELVREKERIKRTMKERQERDKTLKDRREQELDPLMKIPYEIKKKSP